MSVSERIKAINNKIDQSKDQYDLDRQTAKISDLWSGNISKYKFLTSKGVSPKKDMLEKGAALKRFKYLRLGSELKKQTSVAEKQYQKLDNTYEYDKRILKKSII